MRMRVYYNEIDRSACAWLRELMKARLIPEGEIDDRSIIDVRGDDLAGYDQCHFFAGIGGWPYALKLAQWPDDEPVWTGSCPCQPFSAAGKQQGSKDSRNLWPAFCRLISECRPLRVFGEQVSGALGFGWIDRVRSDLEKEAYSLGVCVLGAHSVGAPHIRQRLYWVAHGMADSGCISGEPRRLAVESGESTGAPAAGAHAEPGRRGIARGMADTGHGDIRNGTWAPRWKDEQRTPERQDAGIAGFWSRYELIPCLDGKARRIEPSTFPLVNGLPKGMVRSSDQSAPLNAQATTEARIMRLRGYGNAIVPQVAAEFIRALRDLARGN